jgi:hypothetical protein
MINFRFHIVSLIAIFLALGVGVIMGTAVIDSAVVDRLEAQQRGLESDIDDVTGENGRLRGQLGSLRDRYEQLDEEGWSMLVDNRLFAVPVLVVTADGVDGDLVEDIADQLGAADAQVIGRLRLTDRFALDDDDEQADLAEALGLSAQTSPGTLRNVALTRLAAVLRGSGVGVDPVSGTIAVLRDAGFLDVELPDDAPGGGLPAVRAGTRIVMVGDDGVDLAPEDGFVPLARSLVLPRDDGLRRALLVGVEPALEEPEDGAPAGLVELLRDDADVSDLLSTVDTVDDLAGRLGLVVVLDDLGDGKQGHFGRTSGSQRLLPARDEG